MRLGDAVYTHGPHLLYQSLRRGPDICFSKFPGDSQSHSSARTGLMDRYVLSLRLVIDVQVKETKFLHTATWTPSEALSEMQHLLPQPHRARIGILVGNWSPFCWRVSLGQSTPARPAWPLRQELEISRLLFTLLQIPVYPAACFSQVWGGGD